MPNWFDKSEQEIIDRLKNVLRTDNFQFIGRYEPVSEKDFGFFKDVRSLSGVKKFYPKDNGTTDELKVRPLEIYTKSYDKLLNGKWYIFYAVPAAEPLKKSKRNPFLLQTDWKRVKDISLLKGNMLIENIKEDALNTPESIAGNLMRAIETISIDINTEPTTFIFELIQNADDYPNPEKNVSITFKIDNSHLIIKHNGSNFEVNNTVALCGVNEGDKREDANKIGFKGIGFKSIFKDANYAYIKSGDFSFRFDEEFWKRQGIEIFWHITPINTNISEFQQILKSESNVNIVIKPRANQALETYKNTFLSHFNDERILLFLRNVKSLNFESEEKKFEISNSSDSWKILTESNIAVPIGETVELNRKINFPDKRIPVKFYDLSLTEIGFGFKANQKSIEVIKDANVYAYLPTKINLGFSFILNGNFIPDASRTKIYDDITWNTFLFLKSGELFIHQIVKLLQDDYDKESVISQIPSFEQILLNLNDDDKNQFINSFKKGFDEQILKTNFIPTQNGELETLSNILIDETGLAEFLKNDFLEITGITQKLINSEVGEGIEKVKALINEYSQGIIYSVEQLKIDFKTPLFQEWLKITENNYKIIQFLCKNKELKSLLKTEKIVLSESKDLFKTTDLYSTIPNEVGFLANNKIDSVLNDLLLNEKIELELTLFNACEFYKANCNKLNSLLINESNIINIWCFIYDNWLSFKDDDEVKKSLNQLSILCKPVHEGLANIKTVSSVYISKEFSKEDEVETIIATLKLKDKFFIESKFISTARPDIKKWNEVLKSSRAKSGLKDVITELVSQLPIIDDSLHFKACFEIFNYWKANKEKPETQLTETQINLIKQNLKIQSIDNEYHSTKECIISDHYNNNQLIATWLPILELPNQVSKEYAPKTNQVGEWKNFLIRIGCVELTDKQNVFDAKTDFYINSQEELQEKHFEIIKSLSDLYKASNENGLAFNFKDVLQEIKLKASDENWHLPNNIHLSSSFCISSDLDLQKDEEIKEINYLSSEYEKEDYTREFFKKLGVKSGFEYVVFENIPYDKFPNQLLAQSLMYSKAFEKRRAFLLSKFKQSDINRYSNVSNHIEFYCLDLVVTKKYNSKFIEFIKKNKQSNLFQQSSLINNGSKYVSTDNNFVAFLKNNETISNQNNELIKPIDLYSLIFDAYISDKSLLPKTDFNKIILSDIENLEEILGIKQLLNESLCIELLSRAENRITFEEIKQLQIVEILSDYAPNEEEKKKLFLLNTNLEWKPLNKLFTSGDDQFQIDPKQKLHEDFISIAGNFEIQELSEGNLILKTSPKTPIITNEIEEFFKSKSKFIAFKIDQSNYEAISEEIIENIASIQFYEITSIAKVFPEINPIYKLEINFYFDESENKIFFQGNWKTNKQVIEFIFSTINSEIERTWFENVINRWDDKKIIETLIDLFGNVPPEWLGNFIETDPIDEPPIISNNTFEQEVYDFINELEDNEWSAYIPELKNILELSISHPREKQKLYNLIAKLKLARFRNIHFEKNDQDFNHLENETEKYFVHSARGSFAYIHTNEILRMKKEDYKMALDFGSKSEIKIYETAEEILELNTNHLLLYQYDKPIEALISFCEANKEANKHLLIVDRDNSRDKSKEMFKLLNPEDDYQ
jgi:hypothetical protein